MSYRLHLKIPGLPKPFNAFAYRGRWAIKKEKEIWLAAISALAAGKLPPKPLEKAKLTFIRHSSKCPDFDGLVSSFKFCCDPLVTLGVLIDDNMEVTGTPTYLWFKAKMKEGRVEVIVES